MYTLTGVLKGVEQSLEVFEELPIFLITGDKILLNSRFIEARSGVLFLSGSAMVEDLFFVGVEQFSLPGWTKAADLAGEGANRGGASFPMPSTGDMKDESGGFFFATGSDTSSFKSIFWYPKFNQRENIQVLCDHYMQNAQKESSIQCLLWVFSF